jgi:hypothetical protein
MVYGKKKIAVLQSNYIPWKGYFDIINSVDEFVFLEDVQYTRRDWRNRNIIKTKDGLKWLTIPVRVKGKYLQPINEITIADDQWAEKHWNLLESNYRSAPYFSLFEKDIMELYFKVGRLTLLSEINILLIKGLNNLLDIRTQISISTDYITSDDKNQRIIDICEQSGASVYYTGPHAMQYLDQKRFEKNNIQIVWLDYNGYKPYPQQYGEFCHNVSVIDLLFNTGEDAPLYLKGF